jgi:hypothetical protein
MFVLTLLLNGGLNQIINIIWFKVYGFLHVITQCLDCLQFGKEMIEENRRGTAFFSFLKK